MIGTYVKFILQVVATIGAALVPALADDTLTSSESVNVVIIGLGALTVLGATNLPAGVWRYAKGIFATATAVAVAASSLMSAGFTPAEMVQLALAALSAAGVAGVRNAGSGPRGESTVDTGLPRRG